MGKARSFVYPVVLGLVLSAVGLWAWLAFGNPFSGIARSAVYAGKSIAMVFSSDGAKLDPPTFGSGDMEWLLGYAESSLYSVYAGFAFSFSSGGVAWAAKGLAEAAKVLFRLAVALPLIVLFLFLVRVLLLSGSEVEVASDSRAVRAASRAWRRLKPVRDEAGRFALWLRSSIASRAMLIATCAWIFVASGLLAASLEVVGFYFGFCFTASGADAGKEVVSLAAQAIRVFARMGFLPRAALAGFLAYRAIRSSALAKLRALQAANEEVADGLSVCTAITGAPGIGKTKMMTSLVIDLERSQREAAFSIMKKYASAFPRFDWPSLERWVEEGVVGKEICNRAQIRAKLGSKWASRGKDGFFNWKPGMRERFFDGARGISLGYAADCYAEAYFLYFPGVPLAVTNYSVRFSETAFASGHFPLYPPASSYLSGGCRDRESPEEYSAIVDFDSRRIAKRLDQDDVDAASIMDGQVEAYTEVDKERGNRNDYRGLKADGGANAINDGFNWSVKLTRHDFTIDGYPFTKILMDTQRPDSVNADLRETCEDSIFIYSKGGEENALPFFGYANDVCDFLVSRWESLYYRIRAARGRGRTALTVVGNALSSALRNWALRMRKSYGFERVLFKHTSGAGSDFAGVSGVEEYYFIKRKVESGLYATDCYRGLADARKMGSGKGYLDAPRYASTTMTIAEMQSQHSYFIDRLVDQTARAISERKAASEKDKGEKDGDLQDKK